MVEHDQGSCASGRHAKVIGLLWEVGWVREAAGEPRDRPGRAARASATASNTRVEICIEK